MNRSLDSFQRTVNVAWPAMQEARAKAHLIKVATDGHAKIMREQTARAGQRPDFDFYVNRSGNTNLNSVVLPGPVVYQYRYIREIMIVAIGELRRASPVVSGAYRDNHTLYINGVEAQDVPDTIHSTDQVMIANPAPYARRLELGVTKSGRAFVIQVEPRIYRRVGKRLQDRYGNVAKIIIADDPGVDLHGSALIKGAVGRFGISTHHQSGGKRTRRRLHGGESIKAPAIFIELLN